MATPPQPGAVLVPPHDLNEEMLVLGSLLLDPSLLAACQHVLSPDDFYHPHHRAIYQAALDTETVRGTPFTLMAVTHVLRERKQLEEIGSPGFLCALVENVQTTASFGFHVRAVAAKSQARRIAALALSLYELAMADTGWQAALKDLAEATPVILRATPGRRTTRLSTVAVV